MRDEDVRAGEGVLGLKRRLGRGTAGWILLLCLVAVALWARGWVGEPEALAAEERGDELTTGGTVTGRLVDELGEPVREAELDVRVDGGSEAVVRTTSHGDGTFVIDMPETEYGSVVAEIRCPHFWPVDLRLSPAQVEGLVGGGSLVLSDVELERRLTPGFWIAVLSFVLVLVLIALERIHKTTAALVGVALILVVSLVGGALHPDLFIFDFERALEYVDFDVIFLVLGMMIVIAVVEETGMFQWLAYQAYRLSRGRIWLLVTILMMVTSFTSALLDNVTTMLLMAPITVQIALTVGLNPVSLLIPEVLASNVGGIATLVGTPSNILIGSYAGLGFNDFVVNLTPGAVLAQVALTLFVILSCRKEYQGGRGRLSAAMRERLRESGRITQPQKLMRAGLIFGVMLVLFVFGESMHLVPAVTAILGAVAMLLWVSPDIEQMLKVVDWTTLMFFIALFITVGALQEVGAISAIAAGMGTLVGGNLVVTILVLVWTSALLSGVIDNIPFAATMLPVVAFLTRTVPGAESGVLWYGLAIGAGLGGNSTLIGSSPNLVTAGISERAGYPISYLGFLKAGLPATVVTVAVATAWLFLRFL